MKSLRSYGFVLILMIPALLTFLWWMLSNNLPVSDSLHFFETCQQYVGQDNFSLQSYFYFLNTLNKALLHTILCAPFVAVLGANYFLIVGILNSIFVTALTFAIYLYARMYLTKSISVLFTLVVMTLSWIAYQATVFEAQLSFTAAAAWVICIFEYWRVYSGYRWVLAMGCSMACVLLSRPAEGIVFIFVFSFLYIAGSTQKITWQRGRELGLSCLVALAVFFVWFSVTFTASKEWLRRGSAHADPFGPFMLKSKDILGFIQSYGLEFLNLPGFTLSLLVLIAWRIGKKISHMEHRGLLLALAAYALLFPMMVTLFLGVKNPVYFYVSYLCVYLLFVPWIAVFEKQQHVLMCSILMFLLVWNLTFVFAGSLGWHWLLKQQQYSLHFKISHPTELLAEHPANELANKVQKSIARKESVSVATILFWKQDLPWIENGTLQLAQFRQPSNIVWKKCLFKWLKSSDEEESLCDLSQVQYVLIGPIDDLLDSEQTAVFEHVSKFQKVHLQKSQRITLVGRYGSRSANYLLWGTGLL